MRARLRSEIASAVKFVHCTSEIAIAVKFAAGELGDASYYKTWLRRYKKAPQLSRALIIMFVA
jgi:hypothetical protein